MLQLSKCLRCRIYVGRNEPNGTVRFDTTFPSWAAGVCQPPLPDQPFMIGASAVWICAICAGVVMLVSSWPKCGCSTPETMYCQR